jgi:hypothetical protein
MSNYCQAYSTIVHIPRDKTAILHPKAAILMGQSGHHLHGQIVAALLPTESLCGLDEY